MKIKELWNFKYNEPILGIEIGDINNNGEVEIIAYTKTGTLLFISLNGKILHQEVIVKGSPIWHLKIYDINTDGKNKLILGGMDGILRIFKCNLSYNLEPILTHKLGSSISGILIEDINNDSLDEIIVFSLDKTLRVLNPIDGKLVWGQIFEDGIGDAIIYANSQNLDNKEIAACGNDGTIRIFEGRTGELLWFKKYSDKIRFVNFTNSNKGSLISCGGDDKKLHFIDIITQNEIKTIEFNDYLWKCRSYPSPVFNNSIVSSYSFSYFDKSTATQNAEFTSELICLNEYLNVKWELIGLNIECLEAKEFDNRILILAGTTKGKLLIIEEKSGKILWNKNYISCINSIQILSERSVLFSCHDDGRIICHKMELSFA
ncbi:MAG: WD40 repeat domain-containing protein [Promethearchaeota archaeon]